VSGRRLGIVKYFTVKDEPQVFVLIVNRLIASAEIDDAQPRVSQAGVLVPVYTEGVRSTMADASQYAAKEIFRRLRAAIGEIDNSCNPTHFDTSRYEPAWLAARVNCYLLRCGSDRFSSARNWTAKQLNQGFQV
jgi:hypothetical protein